MGKKHLLSMIVFPLILISCMANTSGQSQTPSLISTISVEQEPSETPLAIPSVTLSPSPTASPTFTPTYAPTQEPAYVIPKYNGADCYYNPLYANIAGLRTNIHLFGGEKALILGENYDQSMWMIEYPRHGTPEEPDNRLLPYHLKGQTASPTPGYLGKVCWVEDADVVVSGDISTVPIMDCYEIEKPGWYYRSKTILCLPKATQSESIEPGTP
jgi:hypothetical protein